jgi:integrase
MSRHPRLSLIRNSYYFRARFPARLARAFKLTEMRINLKTDSLREAKMRVGHYHIFFERLIDAMTESELLRLIEETTEAEKNVGLAEAETRALKLKLEKVESKTKKMLSSLKTINDTKITEIRLAEYGIFLKRHTKTNWEHFPSILKAEGIYLSEASALLRSLHTEMFYLKPEPLTDGPLSEPELIEYKHKFRGEFHEIWKAQINKIKSNRIPGAIQPQPTSMNSPGVSTRKISFVDLHKEESSSNYTQSLKRQSSTDKEYLRYAEKFDVLIEGTSICDLSIPKLDNLYKDLESLKKAGGTVKRYSRREELVTTNDENKLSLETVEKHTIRLNTLLAFAHQKKYFDLDLNTVDKASLGSLKTHGKKTKKHDDEDRAEPFTNEEMSRIFNSYLYNAEKHRTIRIIYPYHYFFPFLGALTGCRINELAQLDTDDVVANGPIPYIKIEGDVDSYAAGARSLKNAPSRRKVALHPKLIEIGFLDYVAKRKKSKEKKLWDGLKWAEKGRYGALATQFFCRLDGPGGYLNHLGIHLTANDNKNFHSFRHTFVTKLRNEAIIGLTAKHTETLIESITGHGAVDKTTADKYGIHTLERQLEVISKISYQYEAPVMSYAEFFKRYESIIKYSSAKFKRAVIDTGNQ